MTTVRFSLADHPKGTLLTMIESGFENIPEPRRANCVKMNTDGWAWELTEFRAAVELGDRQLVDSGEIVRERDFKTSPERLWELVATPSGIEKWWAKKVDGEFVVSGMATLHFEMPGGKEISGPIKVIEYRKPEVFAFKWHPGEAQGCTWDKYPESEATTTTFTISAVDDGAKLRVVESGFGNIPKPRRFNAMLDNAEGWSYVMGMIEEALV